MKNISKGAFHILLKEKETYINLIALGLASSLILYALSMGFFRYKSKQEIKLLLYVLILGMTLIMANSMIISLTVKDKLSNRIEFFLSNELKVSDLLRNYSVQILRLSSIVPFVVFVIIMIVDQCTSSFTTSILFYISTVLLSFAEIYFFNIISLTAQKNKLFKNMVFFFSFFIIYIFGTFSGVITTHLSKMGLDIFWTIIVFNIVLSSLLLLAGEKKLRKITSETIIRMKGEWV